MDPAVLIPIAVTAIVFGMPVALVFMNKFFKLKEKELALEAEAQRWAERQYSALDSRVQRLESVLLSRDDDLRKRLGATPHAQLMEGPPAASSESAHVGQGAKIKA